MGLGGISVPSLLLILVIVLLLFGTKKLRNLGGDLGSAIKGFKKGLSDEEEGQDKKQLEKSEAEVNEDTSADSKAKVNQDK